MNKPTVKRQGNDFPVGLSQPAHRALASVGIKHLAQLAKFSEAEIKQLHGMGPKGIDLLQRALRAQGLNFDSAKTKPPKGVVRNRKRTDIKDSHDRVD